VKKIEESKLNSPYNFI